ncbi:MAG TPA: cupin domain-containing protein [Mycobacterium sp.]|jgi:quercetin dioxygenase-like cupin family protein|nr:cupin domain-containing protein [Mycobacterium sp.]
MTESFVVRHAETAIYEDPGPVAPGSTLYTRFSGVNYETGAVHSDFGVSRLGPGGAIAAHVHSFEETFHLMDGEVLLATPEATVELHAGDYGVIPVGTPHSWHSTGDGTAVWADLYTPPPRAKYGHDTYRVDELPSAQPIRVDPRDPRTRSFGAITAQQMDPARQSQLLLARSASMRTALLVYSGISLKMMIDSDVGATASTMFMVQYEPDGMAGPHDHPFEECYLIIEGEVDATFDGQAFRLGPGDLAWAGVGCVHSFNATGAPVRWLETQSPQMPARYAYRFARDWQYLSDKQHAASA